MSDVENLVPVAPFSLFQSRSGPAPKPIAAPHKPSGPINKWTADPSRIVLAPICTNANDQSMQSCNVSIISKIAEPEPEPQSSPLKNAKEQAQPQSTAADTVTAAAPAPVPAVAVAAESKPEKKVRLTLAELTAAEESTKTIMTAAGDLCMTAWVAALEASKEYRRLRKDWRRARARLQKRQGKARTAAEPAANLMLIPSAVDTEDPIPEPTEEPAAEEEVDQVEAVEHAVQILQSACDEEMAIAAFHSGQLALRTSIAAPDSLMAERALEDMIEEAISEPSALLQAQQRRYTLELSMHDSLVEAAQAPPSDEASPEFSVALAVEEVAEEAELLQLTIESEQIKRQLAATEAEEADALLAENARLTEEQEHDNELALPAAAGAASNTSTIPEGDEQPEEEDPVIEAAAAPAATEEPEEELENFVVTKSSRRTAVVTSTLASAAPAVREREREKNGVLLFSPPKMPQRPSLAAQTAAQRKTNLAQSRAAAAAEKAARLAKKQELESDLAAHEARRQQLIDSKLAKAAEAERRRLAAREKVESADEARRSKFARVVEAAAGIEQARKQRHAEETKILRAQAKAKLAKAEAAAAAAATETGAEGDECTTGGAAGSSCAGCERCSALKLVHAEERRARHLQELKDRCTNEDDLAKHRATQAAHDAEGASKKNALLEESERRRLEAEARRSRSHEEGKQSKAAAREKKRKELEQQIQDMKQQHHAQHQHKEGAAATATATATTTTSTASGSGSPKKE